MADARRFGQAPAAGEHAADQAVVDAQLAALAVNALLGRAGLAVHLARVARVGVDQHQLADVVQQGRDQQLVAVLVADLARQPVGGALRGHGVQAEALGLGVPAGRALEEVEHGGARGERLDARRAQQLDGLRDARDLALLGRGRRVGDPEHRDHQGDVRLDGGDHVAHRAALLTRKAQETVAGLDERGECLECLKRGSQTASVTLVLDGCCGRLRPSLVHGCFQVLSPVQALEDGAGACTDS